MKKTSAFRTYSSVFAMLVKWRRAPTTRPMTTRRQLSGITVGSLEFKWNAARRNKNIIRTCHIDWKKMHVKRFLNLLSKLFRLRCINTLFLENLDIRHFWLQPCSEIMDFYPWFCITLFINIYQQNKKNDNVKTLQITMSQVAKILSLFPFRCICYTCFLSISGFNM